MIKEFKFNKKRVLLGILIMLVLLLISFFFLLKPEPFIRNVFMKAEHIQILGVIGIVFFLSLFYSFLKLIPREYAIQITDEFLLDNSKYESYGKIEWKDISKIQRLKENSIELTISKAVLKNRKTNLLKKFLRFMQNWNCNNRIIISSALLDCSIEDLFETVTLSYENYKM